MTREEAIQLVEEWRSQRRGRGRPPKAVGEALKLLGFNIPMEEYEARRAQLRADRERRASQD